MYHSPECPHYLLGALNNAPSPLQALENNQVEKVLLFTLISQWLRHRTSDLKFAVSPSNSRLKLIQDEQKLLKT